MKNVVVLFVLLGAVFVQITWAQPAALYKVSLDDRIGQSEAIVEGRVVGQGSFWNENRTIIYTANTVRSYRVFKGELRAETVDVITPGGVVGWEAQSVSPSLQLRVGDTGLFFLSQSRAVSGLQKWESTPAYEPYASVQGFVRYDRASGKSSDVFNVYRDIESELYAPLARRFGPPIVLEAFEFALPVAQKGSQVPVITSFSPNPVTAGTFTVLTISGTGFEAQGANSKVLFANADDGGGTLIEAPDSEEISWSDTEIQVRIPTRAGTGSIAVQSQSGMQGASATALTVDYNLINVAFEGFKRSILRDKVNGGYSLVMSTNVSSQGVDFGNSDAVDPFNRALSTWQSETGFNLRNDGGFTTSNTVAANDDPDIVMFDNDDNPLPNGVLGRAYSGFTSTNGQDWYVQGMDIQFRRDGTGNVTWNFGPASTQFCCYDFESVALHEIGHTHQLGHVIEPGAVMNYNLSNGSEVRGLDAASDVAGGNDVLDFAETKAGGMSRLVFVGVEDQPIGHFSGVRLSKAFPNPTRSASVFAVEVDGPRQVTVDVYDVLGRRVLRLFDGLLPASGKYEFSAGLKDLPAGIYVYSAEAEGKKHSQTLVLQR